MKLPKRIACLLGFLLIGLGGAQIAAAVEVHGRSSTQYTWYNDPVDGSKQWDAAEYLRFSMTGIDSARKLSVQGYGRIDYSSNAPEGENKTNERIYYLYADYRGLMDKVDLRIGRQFVNLSSGSGIIDGVQADVKQIGFVGVTIMGGRDIIFGDYNNVTSHAAAGGMALYLVGMKNTDLDVSYYRTYDYSDTARETLGFNFKQYLLDSVKVYANARYDLVGEVFSEVLGGIKYFPKLDLMLTAEYYQSYPTFDTTSIYSVFAVDKYQESVFRADYTALPWLDLSAGYKNQDFGDGGSGYVTEVGFRVRPSHRLTMGVFFDDTRGDGGNLNGWKTYAEYSDLKKFKVGGGVDYDVYQRDNMTGAQIARKYWAASRYNFTQKMSAYLRVEDNVNVDYSKDMRGRLTFDVDF